MHLLLPFDESTPSQVVTSLILGAHSDLGSKDKTLLLRAFVCASYLLSEIILHIIHFF